MSKYIIEFSDKPSYQEDNIIFYPCKQIPWWSVSKSNIDKLTPLDKALEEAYQRGLDDAWEAARKISVVELNGGLTGKELMKIYGTMDIHKIYDDNTAAEAIAKLKAYEEKQKTDEIKVGDEMKQVTESGTETGLLCTVTAIDGDHMNGISQDGRAIVCSSQVNRWWKKTGRHFDIEKILEEMME